MYFSVSKSVIGVRGIKDGSAFAGFPACIIYNLSIEVASLGLTVLTTHPFIYVHSDHLDQAYLPYLVTSSQ